MSTTKTAILTLVGTLTAGLADTTAINRIWDEVIIDLAADTRQWFTAFSPIDPGTTGSVTNQESLELSVVGLGRLIALFYNGRQLSRESEDTFATQSRNWGAKSGSPVAFTTDNRSDRFVRLYPKNDLFNLGEVGVLYTQSTVTGSIPDVMALPLAMLVMAREFERESNHRDMDFAKSCRALGQEMLNYIVRTD